MTEKPRIEIRDGWYKESHLRQLVAEARQDTAREIFEETEQRCAHLHPRYRHMPKRECELCMQSLKEKYGHL